MDKIYINRDNEKIELKGKDLEGFLEQKAKDEIEYAERQRLIEAEQQAKEAARQSAIDKLKKLGLNEEEIAALVP
jgi:DNA-binding transcriptional regulator YhcF (GntR family)